MASQFDPSDFVDSDFQTSRTTAFSSSTAASSLGDSSRPTSREQVEVKMSEAQIKLADLKRAQEELERERAGLEEVRRRQMEYQAGRGEMVQNLTRGLTLLQETEFATRRDAEDMAKSIAALKEAFEKVQALNEQAWTKDSYNTELTRALAVLENSRMEWHSARLKFSVLSGTPSEQGKPDTKGPAQSLFSPDQSFSQLCKIGFALTWPLALIAFAIFAVLLLRH
jgi:hypothetical protein